MQTPASTRTDTERKLVRALTDLADVGDQLVRAITAGDDLVDYLNGWSTVRLEAAQALRAAR